MESNALVLEIALLAVVLLATVLANVYACLLWARAFSATAQALAHATEASEIVKQKIAHEEVGSLPPPRPTSTPVDLDQAYAEAREAIKNRRGSASPTTDDYAIQDDNAPLGQVGGTRMSR
jgi:hypothetical protein